MDIGSLLQEALTLMLTGMSVVFVFLGILIFLVQQLSRFGAEPAPEPVTSSTPAPAAGNNQVSPDVIAAISAAVKQYRNRHHQ